MYVENKLQLQLHCTWFRTIFQRLGIKAQSWRTSTALPSQDKTKTVILMQMWLQHKLILRKLYLTPNLLTLAEAPYNRYLHLWIPRQADVLRELGHKLALCSFQIFYPLNNLRITTLNDPAGVVRPNGNNPGPRFPFSFLTFLQARWSQGNYSNFQNLGLLISDMKTSTFPFLEIHSEKTS